MRELDVGEVSRRSGVPPSALRFYEAKGLIRPIGRRGLRRQYAADVVDRLALVALGQAAGFSLEEIARIFAAGGRPRIDRARLAARADELDATIRQLLAMRRGLRHAAACPAHDHMECPTFRRLLREAVSDRRSAPLGKAAKRRAAGAGAPATPRVTRR